MRGIAELFAVLVVATGLAILETFWPGLFDEDSG
jgi:hypothetical protein